MKVSPLTQLLNEHEKYQWTNECQASSDSLKQALQQAPILTPLDWTKSFHVHIDASGFTFGWNLEQWIPKNKLHPTIFYVTHKLTKVEANYFITEREGLAMIFKVDKF